MPEESDDQIKIQKKIDQRLAEGKEQFEVSLGPTESCISSYQIAAFLEDWGESCTKDYVREHIKNCTYCDKLVVNVGDFLNKRRDSR